MSDSSESGKSETEEKDDSNIEQKEEPVVEKTEEEELSDLKTEALYYYYENLEEKRVKNLPWRSKKSEDEKRKTRLFRRERPPWFEDDNPEALKKREELREELKRRLGLPPYPPRFDKLKKLSQIYRPSIAAWKSLHEKVIEAWKEKKALADLSSESSELPPYSYSDLIGEDECVPRLGIEEELAMINFGEEAETKEAFEEEVEEELVEEGMWEDEVREESVKESLEEEEMKRTQRKSSKESRKEELEEEDVEEEGDVDDIAKIHPMLRPLLSRDPNDITYSVVFFRCADNELEEKRTVSGWIQAKVSPEARKTAAQGSLGLADEPISLVFLSSLRSSFVTLKAVQKLKNPTRFKIVRSWELNDRHMGQLTGCTKRSLSVKYGDVQTKVWLKGIQSHTPAVTMDNKYFFHVTEDAIFDTDGNEPEEDDIPRSESVAEAMERTYGYWKKRIIPEIKKGEAVLVIAHDVNIRGIIQHLLRLPLETAGQMRFLKLPLKVQLTADCYTAVSWEYLAELNTIIEFCKVECEKKKGS